MNSKRLFVILIMTGTLMALATGVRAQSKASSCNFCQKLTGTWLVTATFTDPEGIPPFKVLFSFMPGRTDDEGTLIDTNEFELTPNPICTPDQGVWKKVGDRDYIATHLTFCFDATMGYNPAGPAKVRDAITLSKTGDEFDGRQFVEGFDTSGNVVFTGKVMLHGVRVQAEAPPQP
jgi:hypothetical protein